MRTETINGHQIEFYDTIDALPISQFHLYSKYALVQSGIGDSIGDIDGHINRIVSFMKSDQKKASRELLNLRRCLFTVLSEVDYRHKAFLCLVRSVDGQKWEDFSDDGIDRLYSMITDATVREMAEIEDALRKRLDAELMQYFPEIFDSAMEKNYCELLRQRAMLQLSEILDKQDHTDQIRALTDRIFYYYDPKNFEGKESAEIKFDKDFEEMCMLIAKEFGGKVKDYTVMEFYSAENLMKQQQEQMKKLKKKK